MQISLILNHTFSKFILVGILNTLFGYAVFAVFTRLGLHYTAAMLLATFLGVIFNFKTIGNLVFKNHDNRLLGKFILIYLITYLLNITLIKMLLAFSINLYIAGACSIIVAATCSYFLNKKLFLSNRIL